jgi:hypothetical protein
MNVSTAGSLLNSAGARLWLFDNLGNSVSVAPASVEVRADAPVPPQGSAQTLALTWDLSGVSLVASGFRIEMQAAAPSMALDAVRLDLNYNVIPAPGALALLLVAGFTAGRRRR